MKCWFLLLICASTVAVAQRPSSGVLFTYGSDYIPAQLTYIDGHQETGFVYGFIYSRWVEFANPLEIDELATIEDDLNLSDKRFSFKKTKDSEAIKLSQNEVKEVILYWDTDHREHFKLMNLKTVNGKGEIVDLKKRAWLPLWRKDKVNIFSLSVYENGRYAFSMVYLNNEKDNFAINPIDMNNIDFFNLGKINGKVVRALKEVFNDCPEYLKTLEGNPKEVVLRYFKNKGNKQVSSEVKAFDDAHPEMSRAERREYHAAIAQKVETDPYVKLISEYTAVCPK